MPGINIFDFAKQAMDPAFAGMVAETQFKDVLSLRWPTNKVTNFSVGHAAVYGAAQGMADVGAGVFAGISIFLHSLEAKNTVNGKEIFAYKPGEVMGLMRKGTIWVPVAVAITAPAPAYYTAAGIITNVSTGNTAIPGGVFETLTAANGLSRLRLN